MEPYDRQVKVFVVGSNRLMAGTRKHRCRPRHGASAGISANE
jgi:hypothetical protein